ncbi:Inositol 2-dehydrogenase/D-chiro-inositol 3-dehydrogenase [Aquisphaera giovannonii]|uniref:Inositol 2-dehydrogenase/D-chiro-inositol 3-dehydrogenase n=1 Tax=Aquisphaera giovannonii TaxID=406548 RepID=A0A5B9W4Y2_9BACT|nr:twin-arginine translocation signal domain-containing protein [Aquisphaera giovannonii]QEH35337.1 Inositol 2-dehydrogenase/D-chiro-inositol 3-dehydrogenase [Aquisphaera giovannonii]
MRPPATTPNGSPSNSTPSRREFLAGTAAAAAAASLAGPATAAARARQDATIPIALVGCGGRGTGAAGQALSTKGPTRLVAMADVFPDRLEASLDQLNASHSHRVDVPAARQFLGLDAYREAIKCVSPGGVVLLATPPAFRPIHVEYAVSRGCHVFMEKSFAVDGPGVRRILAAGEEAGRKNLKVAGGLMSRHYRPLEEAVERIHGGAIGDVIACYAYRMHSPVGFSPRRAGEGELAHQIRNYSNFTWLNGSFLLDWLIHNLDVCCWAKGAWPVSCQGQGGRQVRDAADQLFDHYLVEYTFPDGTRLMAEGRHMDQCWGFFGDVIHGSKGCALLGEGVTEPKLYRGHRPTPKNQTWKYAGPPCDHYQAEHDLLFEAIRKDTPYNEAGRCAHAALVGIMGRMAAESGKMVTWDEALSSKLELAPGLDHLTMDSPAPVQPDARGHYPVAMPGITVAV